MSSLSDFVGSAVASLKGEGTVALTSALGSAAQGNFSDAASTLAGAANQFVTTAGSSGGTSFGDDLSGINRRGDAVQNWCWYAVMPDVTNSNSVSLGTSPSPLGTLQGGLPLVSCPWYYVQTANLPMRTISTDSFKRNGHDVHNAQSYSVGQLTLGLFMDSSSKAFEYIKAWQGLVLANANPKVVGNQGNWGYPADYKKDIYLVVLSVQRNVLLNVRLINCWPSEPQQLEFGSGDATGMVLSVNFACEDVDITVNSDKGLLDTLTNTVSGFALSGLQSFGSQAIADQLSKFAPG